MAAHDRSKQGKKPVAQDCEGDPTAEIPRRKRQKGPTRYAPNLNPGPGIDFEHAPFSTAEVEDLIRHVGHPIVVGATSLDVCERLNLHARSHKLRVELDRQPTDRMLIAELTGLKRSALDLQSRLPLLNDPDDHGGQHVAASPARGLVWQLQHYLATAMADRAAQHRKETAHSVLRRGIWASEEDASLTEEAMFGASTAEDLLTNLAEGAGALAAACGDAISEAEQRCMHDEVAGETPMATALRDTVHDLLGFYAEFFGRKATVSKDGDRGRPIGPALRFVQGALHIMGVETSDENVLRISRPARKPGKPGDVSAG